ncbi:MAG: aminotransferase class I/II [Anaerolineaceae bacterium]|nr:aminotransferase class I/II [Anaerolineaceae bacterium]
MNYNFDEIINRTHSDSVKWNYYKKEALPLWVADMDFKSPQPVVDALLERVQHGVFGYPLPDPVLKEVICARLKNLYAWEVIPEEIEFLPGVVNGFNAVIHALTEPGDGVLMQTPVYPPFLGAPQNARAFRQENQLARGKDQYQVDFTDFENQIKKNTSLFLFCNPHNPVGRVFNKQELETLADICLRHDVAICSDEIHCDLIFKGYQHLPIASLDAEVAAKTITLMAPSKTFNIAGLECSFAVVQSAEMKKRLETAYQGLVSHVNIMGYTAALAAYEHGQEWLDQLLVYLEQNRDYLVDFVQSNLPGVKMTVPEGTYLAWLDFNQLNLEPSPFEFLMNEGKVALNDGKTFGKGGDGFVRLNFGCPRKTLMDGLKRLQEAVYPS